MNFSIDILHRAWYYTYSSRNETVIHNEFNRKEVKVLQK